MAHKEPGWRKVVGSDNGLTNWFESRWDRQLQLDELLQQEEEPEGFKLTDIVTKPVGALLEGWGRLAGALPTGFSAASQAASEMEDTGFLDLATVPAFFKGVGQSLTGGERVQGSELLDPKRHDLTGVGKAIFEGGARIPGTNTKTGDLAQTVLGGAADIAADPLLGLTAGAGRGARELTSRIGAVAGEDVAQAVAKKGVAAGDEILQARIAQASTRQTFDPAARAAIGSADPTLAARLGQAFQPTMVEPADAGARTIRELLEQEAGGFTVRQGNADRQLRLLERRAGGGLGLFGQQTGIGAGLMDAAGDRALATTAPVRRLLSPTAAVKDELGGGAADAVRMALNTRTAASRTARRRLEREFADNPEELKRVYKEELPEIVNKSVVDDLRELAPRLVADEAGEGLVQLGDGFVPKVVADVMENLHKTTPNELVRWTDTATAALKKEVTLQPILNPLHVPRNIASNMLFASMYGGVHSLKPWKEARRLRKALHGAKTPDGGLDTERLRELLPDRVDFERATQLHKHQLVGRGHAAFDDVGAELADKNAHRLNPRRYATELNAWHEELSRGAVFLKALDDGLKPQAAWKRSSDAMLDYTSEGLSQFERDVLQRIVFFYKFPRRAIPRGLRFMAENPGAAMALSRAGLGINQQDRNDLDMPIGYFFDSPLEAVAQDAFGLVNDEGELDPLSAGKEVLHPALKALVDPDERRLEDIVPPVGQLKRALDPERRGDMYGPGTLVPGAVGVRQGKDYDRLRWEEDFEERLAEKGEPTPKDEMVLKAIDLGIEDPYDKTKSQLAKALKAAGMSDLELQSLAR